jgi:hypothetical protein
VVGVADKLKTLAAQGSDGSFLAVREDDIVTAAVETPECWELGKKHFTLETSDLQSSRINS